MKGKFHCTLKSTLASAIALVVLVWAAPMVQAQTKTAFDLPAQPLADSLRAVGSQTNINLLFDPPLVAGKTAPALKAQLTADEALTRLLVGTGIRHEFLNETTIVLSKADAVGTQSSKHGASSSTASGEPGTDGPKEGSNSGADSFRVAQASQGSTSSAPPLDTFPKLEEVIVTAQKREERLLDVPISIVALSASELQRRGIVTLEDLPFAAPGLSISDSGNSRNIQIRGVSNIVGNGSLIGLYLDEADMTLGASAVQVNPSVYDLDRVEVLRGPQGTLYGEGSAGGTIRFITRKPDLNRFAFDSDVAALFTQDGAPSQRINAVVNVPLIENQLALRVTGTFDHEGGWIDQPAADQKNINWQDLTNVRVKGLWQPNAQFTATGMVVINRNDRSFDISDQGSPHLWTQVFNFTTTPRMRNDYDLYNLTLTYDFTAARLLSTTSYLSASVPTRNQGYSYQYGSPPPATRTDYYAPIQRTNDHALTQELRLNSIVAGPLQWTVGGFYRHYRDSNDTPVNYFGVPDPAGTLPDSYPVSVETLFKSWSVFGDASYQVLDRLTIGAGIRYFKENQEFADFVAPNSRSASFHSNDPRVYAQYKLTNDANVYASASKGFRSGGFNSYPTDAPTYQPESVWTYELGTKLSMLEARARLDVALFWSNYEDYQTYGLVPGGSTTIVAANAGRARIKGVEWELTLHPAERWNLGFNGDYLDSKFLEVNTLTSPDTGFPSSPYIVGDPLDLVPKYQFTVSAERTFSWSGKPGFVRLDYAQQGRETFRNRSFGPWYSYESDVIGLLNFRVNLDWGENLKLGFFAQNLLNENGFANPLSNVGSGVRPRPRTYGVEFSTTVE